MPKGGLKVYHLPKGATITVRPPSIFLALRRPDELLVVSGRTLRSGADDGTLSPLALAATARPCRQPRPPSVPPLAPFPSFLNNTDAH